MANRRRLSRLKRSPRARTRPPPGDVALRLAARQQVNMKVGQTACPTKRSKEPPAKRSLDIMHPIAHIIRMHPRRGLEKEPIRAAVSSACQLGGGGPHLDRWEEGRSG